MARPAYTNIPDGDVDVDSPLDADLFTALRDNDEALRIQVLHVNVAEVTETSSTYPGSPNASFRLYVPDLADYTSIQRTLTFEAEVKTTSGTMTFKVQDNATATDSTETTSTSSTFESKEVVLNLAAGWVDTIRTIDVYMKTTAGTASLRSVDSVTSRMEY